MFTNNYGDINIIISKLNNIENKLKSNDSPKKINLSSNALTREWRSVFGKYFNGGQLSPFVEWSGSTVNVYWKGIEQAAEYKITFYKLTPLGIYKMKDFTVSRTDCYLSADSLVGGGYIIKVFAYGRDGSIVAEAEAVNGEGLPHHWM